MIDDRKKATLIGAVACLLNIAGWQAASAEHLLYSPDADSSDSGAIETALPLDKIASVSLPRGSLIIHGDKVLVTMVPEWQFDRHQVLSGRVLDTRHISTTAPSTISGVLFFTDGEWIGYFDDKAAVESLATDKETISGRINAVSNLDIEVVKLDGTTIAVPLSAVQSIRSPRAFSFDIPLRTISASTDFKHPVQLSTGEIRLSQLGKTFRLAQLKSTVRLQSKDGDVSVPKLVALGTTVSLLNMAQLAPLLGISLGAEPTLERRAFFKSYAFNAPDMSK